jgi:cell division transport system ATP-binding protein
MFRRFQSVGVTVLIATHDINLINTMDERIMHIENGMITDDGAHHDHH